MQPPATVLSNRLMRRVKVEVSEQVADFVARQAPGPRRKLRAGLRGLGREEGDIRALEGPLEGWSRLRVGGFRVVFRWLGGEEGPVIRCDFAERRALVYESFEAIARLMERGGGDVEGDRE